MQISAPKGIPSVQTSTLTVQALYETESETSESKTEAIISHLKKLLDNVNITVMMILFILPLSVMMTLLWLLS